LSRDFDVVIVGAGVVGCVAASLLVARRVAAPERIALLAERFAPSAADPADWDLRVFALSRASESLLREAGVWESLPRDRVFGYERMCVWDAAGMPGGRGSLTFDCAEIGEPNLGSIVDGAALQSRALAAARDAGVLCIEAGASAIATSDAGLRVGLADGRRLDTPLLLAADGTHSPTRGLVGIATAGHAYHQDALVAHVHTAEPHRNTAWQRFLATGPLALLPLPDGRTSIVWSAARAEARRLHALEPAAFSAALTAASGGVLGACELASPIASFPLQLQYALEYVRPHVALLGDAAHAVHPLAGQGLNLGLLDCAALADALAPTERGHLGDFRRLRRYERWRKSENLLAAAAMDGFDRVFSNADPWLAILRSRALGAVDKAGFLKRELARRALGLAGDLPRTAPAPDIRADRSSRRR
jgi:2-octaprenylphenol hydroxylase